MIESLAISGKELASSSSEIGKGFDPDSHADISPKTVTDVRAPLPGEKKGPDFFPKYNPDERIPAEDKIPMEGEGAKWEHQEPTTIEHRGPIDGSGLPHPPPLMNEASLSNNTISEINTNPDSRAEVPIDPIEQLKEKNPEGLKPNEWYCEDGHWMQTDDKGQVYSKDGELLPNTEYTLNDVTYKTDENGNKVSWEGTLKTYSPEAERDGNAQAESGGKDRLPGDDGGHLEARILGGDPGNGNLEPMRDTVNRGDYKKSENEIADAINNGHEVHDKGTIYREDPTTTRPTKIEREYEYGDTKKVLIVDNVEGSTDLVDGLEGIIDDVDYQNLKDEIQEMRDDGDKVSVTSTCKELNADGSVKKVTVGIRDETTGDKWYQTYTPGNNA